jgi:hypothetical protein
MGGLGSGRRFMLDRKMTVAQCLSIEIAQFNCHRDICFSGNISWINKYTNEELSSISYLFLPADKAEPMIILSYTIEDRLIDEPIILRKSKTRFGGSRWWFTCPLCKKRMGKLYLKPKSNYFACRRCHALRYHVS